MLVRLWWKEFRVFGPAWLLLLVAAGLLQWFFIAMSMDAVRDGGLTFAALCWAVLYAFAVASASFASERESNTLGFLDALPVSRSILWFGKVSFALVSTIVLVLILIGMAEWGTLNRPSHGSYSWWQIFQGFGMLLFQGLAWGFFWSSMSKNTLLSALLTIISVVVASITSGAVAAAQMIDEGVLLNREVEGLLIFLMLGLMAFIASFVVMAQRPSRRWSLLSTDRARTTKPIAIRSASTGRSLFWQIVREGGTTALLVAFLALLVPAWYWYFDHRIDGVLPIFLAFLAALMAGVNVFGSDNVVGSRAFLVHHGVKASAVWSRRILTWGLVMASILGVIRLSINGTVEPVPIHLIPGQTPRSELFLVLTIASLNAFTVGLICGMAIRRRITAVLVGTMACLVLIPMQFGLIRLTMIPVWSLTLIPLILIAVSAAWADDWLLEPEGLRRWIRLGLLIGVPFGLLASAFISVRALGVEDVGPLNTAMFRDEEIPREQNAAEVYRRAIRLIKSDASSSLYRSDGINSGLLDAIILNQNPLEFRDQPSRILTTNQPAIDLARQASALPRSQFEPFEKMTIASDDSKLDLDLKILGDLVALEAKERLARGELAGAWDDLLALFRMANQLVETAPTFDATAISTFIHHRAVGLSFEWLADKRQTPELIRKALADLKALPPLPDLSRALRLESWLIEKALNLSGHDLASMLLTRDGYTEIPPIVFLHWSKILCAPWERQRARRLFRKWILEDLAKVSVEPYLRKPGMFLIDYSGQESILSSSLSPLTAISHYVAKHDVETVGRRALIQALALVVWKLEHGGKDAEKLEVLVPGLLDRLPLDPFSGKPFEYVHSIGQLVSPPILPATKREISTTRSSRRGQRLLFSVGIVPSSQSMMTSWTIREGEPQKNVSDIFLFAIP
jgi:hypothetical protein